MSVSRRNGPGRRTNGEMKKTCTEKKKKRKKTPWKSKEMAWQKKERIPAQTKNQRRFRQPWIGRPKEGAEISAGHEKKGKKSEKNAMKKGGEGLAGQQVVI